MVPCLHQGNIHTKRKLRVWRDQKCIPLVGAITPLRDVKIPCLEGGSTGSRTESWVNCDGPISMVPYLHQGNIYTKMNLQVWRDQKCIPLVGAITPLTCAGCQTTPPRGTQYRVQNGKLGKLLRKYGNGTVFALSKYLYQKEATGMERPEMHSASRCNNPTYLCGMSKYPVQREADQGPERKVG